MKTLHLFPPNYQKIKAAFNVRGKPIIFCYGPIIYNPARITVPDELHVHESVHSRQQGDYPETWWDRYIADKAFRLSQELPAHRAEYCYLSSYRADALDRIADRLASPLYGSLVTAEQARRMIASAAPAPAPL